MARKKRKKGQIRSRSLEKSGQYGEAVIPTFSGAVNALRNRYRANFPDMVLFLHFNAMGKNFVFQRIDSFPLRQITYEPQKSSIELFAEWKAQGALSYLAPPEALDIKTKEGGRRLDGEK